MHSTWTRLKTPVALLLVSLVITNGSAAESPSLTALPGTFTLKGKSARQQLIVMSTDKGQSADRTREAQFSTDTPEIIQVSPAGIVTPIKSGEGRVTARVGDKEATARVKVIDGERALPVTFERDVLPILARAGCNAGACHGKQGGQNGFQLSLLGFDADFDYRAITQESRGRRIFPAAPEHSLFLRKASAEMPHGGGRKLPRGSDSYQTVLTWLANATPRTPADTPALTGITLEPTQRLMRPDTRQQLIVTAHYADGTSCDVTHLTMFQSNESAIVAVDEEGVITAGALPGEAAIMARFMEKFAVCNVLIPLPEPAPKDIYAKLPRNNFIDDHVWAKLEQLGIAPSPGCDDATFHRRAYLDVIGRLPTPEETRRFLASTEKDKRAKLIDELLNRPEYADFWANKWADLLRPNPYRVGIKAVYNFDAWLRASFRANKPYDQFVREIITAKGSTFQESPVTLFRDRRDPAEVTTMVSQLFLGVRLDCAKCHHHPFEVWGQDDFYSFAAHFARIGRKGRGISPPISGSEEFVFAGTKGEVTHPRTGEVMSPRPLLGKPTEMNADVDPRQVLADWMVSKENPFFSKVIVNRIWADLMGRGLVDPVDDLRATNPPSNGPLLEALAADFREHDHDLKHLIRTITLSHAYQLSSSPNAYNEGDIRNYSRHYRKRLRAEVLLDAVCDITGVEEKFSAMPPGSRAMELWTVRSQSIFLDAFGRPDPNQDPPCERTSDTTVVQALHLMNAPRLHEKVVSEGGRMARLAASEKKPAQLIEELYLLVYGRLPDEEESRLCLKLFEQPGGSRRQAVEDITWSLLNTPEFVLID